jgi:heterodisulfide reductase subunit B
MTQISESQAFELIRRLLQSAADYNADMILCMCPMCQLNLDGYQSRVNGHFGTNFNLPIIYFTQMLGIAFGLDPKTLGFGKELVAGMPVIKSKLNGQPVGA